ncbi:MAG TPA: hypothetical protein VFK88_06175 [Gallionella sp.]|nr:hypothetical protein [Gallionella sp.]
MTNSELKPFGEIKHSDKLLRLDWFGGIQGSLGKLDNPLIECFFTPFDDPGSKGAAPRPRVRDQFIAGIAVGYLPTQFLGKYFRKGKPAALSDWLRAECITFDLDVSFPGAVTECTLPDLRIDPGFEFIAYRLTDFAKQAGVKLLRGTLQSSTNSNIRKFPAEQIVAIHEMELIRFYLTNSSFSCRNIFTGAFTNENLTERVVNIIHEPVAFDEQMGRGRFVYRHGYKENDAPILGRILFDQSALTLKAAQRVHSKMLADHINSGPRLVGYPRTLFPFIGNTRLTLSGRRISTANGFIFLAYRILSCTSSFPYNSLSYCDEIAPGGAPAPEDAPIAFAGEKAPEIGPAHHNINGTTGVSTSQERPSSASIELRSELGRRDYPGLKDVLLIKEKLRDCTHRSEKKSAHYIDTLINASTGRGSSGASSAARQSITERIVARPSVPPDLKTFMLVIHGLRTLHPDWNIDTIVVGEGYETDGEQASYFPEVPCPKKKRTIRQFSYVDDAKLDRRSFICVQICAYGQYVYLFEAQRRLRSPASPDDLYKEDMAILLLRTPAYEEILGDDFLPMITLTVEKNGWPNDEDLSEFVRGHTVHNKGVQTVEVLCERVAQLINRNVSNSL